ncbi:LysE family translocator [Celerinatantimonas yamalensis]|uniref:LysE family translocator n=1 Tax=Celerinatantimonas yamalensis TaxID=559956 RepID=A0ABW9G8Y9_9GAMM
MAWGSWLPLAMVCLLGAMSPGPSLAMVIRHTVGGGRRNGLVAAWCHTSGIAVYAALTVFGLATLLVQARSLFALIAMIGGGYLIWLGWGSFRCDQSATTLPITSTQSSLLAAARDGLSISLLNPKILLFFIALFSPFVVQSAHRGWLIATPWVIDGCWYSLVVLLLSQARILDWLRAHQRYLDRFTGLILLGIGGYILLTTISAALS